MKTPHFIFKAALHTSKSSVERRRPLPAGGENTERTEPQRRRVRKRDFMPCTHFTLSTLQVRENIRRWIVRSALLNALCPCASVLSVLTPAAALP